MTRSSRQRGFTLIELLITMVVTIFGLMGILALHITLTQGNDAASRTQEAVAIGSKAIETLRSQRTTDMAKTLTGSTTSVPPINVTNWIPVTGSFTGRNGVTYQVDVHVTSVNGSTNLWKLRVEVIWTEDGSTLSHTIPMEVIRTTQEAL